MGSIDDDHCVLISGSIVLCTYDSYSASDGIAGEVGIRCVPVG